MSKLIPRTSMALRDTTKDKMNQLKAPGQCYDGFLCQLVDFWEEMHNPERDFRQTQFAETHWPKVEKDIIQNPRHPRAQNARHQGIV